MAKYHPQGHQRNYSYDFDSYICSNNEMRLGMDFLAHGFAQLLHRVINLDIINEQTDLFERQLHSSVYNTPRNIPEDNVAFSSEDLKHCLSLRNLNVIEEEEENI